MQPGSTPGEKTLNPPERGRVPPSPDDLLRQTSSYSKQPPSVPLPQQLYGRQHQQHYGGGQTPVAHHAPRPVHAVPSRESVGQPVSAPPAVVAPVPRARNLTDHRGRAPAHAAGQSAWPVKEPIGNLPEATRMALQQTPHAAYAPPPTPVTPDAVPVQPAVVQPVSAQPVRPAAAAARPPMAVVAPKGLAVVDSDEEDEDDEFFDPVSPTEASGGAPQRQGTQPQLKRVSEGAPPARPVVADSDTMSSSVEDRVSQQSRTQAPSSSQPAGRSRASSWVSHTPTPRGRAETVQPLAPSPCRSLSPRLVALSPRQKRGTHVDVVELRDFMPNLERARKPPTELFGRTVEGRQSSTFQSRVKRGCDWLDKPKPAAQDINGKRHPKTEERLVPHSTFTTPQPEKQSSTFASKVPKSIVFRDTNPSYVVKGDPPKGRAEALKQRKMVDRLYSQGPRREGC